MSRLLSPPFRTAPHASRREALRLLSLAGLTALLPGTAASAADFEAFVQGLWPQAQAAGVSRETFETATAGLKPETAVLAKPKAQAEFTISIPAYLGGAVTNSRVARGRAVAAQYEAPLARAYQRHGVPGEIIVAILGVESNFGVAAGGSDALGVLATLAWKGHRAETFVAEFVDALILLEKGYATRGQLRGSWAGAMGHTQFMPSAFVKYAQDGDGDGHKNIWTNRKDAFASIANYLKTEGWRPGESWGRQVQLPATFDYSLVIPKGSKNREQWLEWWQQRERPLTEWAKLGVRNIDGSALAHSNLPVTLVMPDDKEGRPYLAYRNYQTLMHWNRSYYFVSSVGYLADAIVAKPAGKHK